MRHGFCCRQRRFNCCVLQGNSEFPPQQIFRDKPACTLLASCTAVGHPCANGGRQRRASALAATRKVSDYIVQESKSIRVSAASPCPVQGHMGLVALVC